MLIITFHNDRSGTKAIANYNVRVLVNQQEIATARINGHRRADGWEELVRRFVGILDAKDG
jgi:hypothetical protein